VATLYRVPVDAPHRHVRHPPDRATHEIAEQIRPEKPVTEDERARKRAPDRVDPVSLVYEKVVISEALRNIITLTFLRRHAMVIFDYPNKVIYLKQR